MKLSDICIYGKEKIESSVINKDSYVSTDNMLPDFGGVKNVNSFPVNQKINKYEKGDILLSNIRPYFKKMIIANCNGGCSTDVLVIKSNKNVVPKFIFYRLMTKDFFDYVVSTSKGTKMPRGDKEAIMNYELDIPSTIIQNKIVKFLDNINAKIVLNNEINDNLLKFIKELYIETFKGEQNKKKIKEVVEFSQGVQVPIEDQTEVYEAGLIRFIRIVDLTQGGKDNIRYIENKDRGIVDYGDVFMIRYGSPGILGWNYSGIIANNLFKIVPKTDETTKNYLYCYFNDDEIQNYIKQNATSSTMPAINFSLLYDRLIAVPNKEKLIEFDRIVENIRLKLLEIKKENERLEQLRDTLLPKLMNGEIDLDKIEI